MSFNRSVMAKVMVIRLQLCNLLGTIFPSRRLSFLGDKQKPCMIKGHEVILYPIRFAKREEKPMQNGKKRMAHHSKGFMCFLSFILVMIL